MAAYTQTFVQGSAPTLAQGVSVGDLWLSPGSNILKVCIAASTTAVAFATVAANPAPGAVAAVAGSVPAGGTGAAAGGWDTAGNRDTAITTATEIKTQLNALLTQLKASGVIS
jgi:hypothetical protein